MEVFIKSKSMAPPVINDTYSINFRMRYKMNTRKSNYERLKMNFHHEQIKRAAKDYKPYIYIY